MIETAFLAERFQLVEFPAGGRPCHLAMAIPVVSGDEQDAWLPPAARPGAGRAASGRGLTRQQALASCIGETAELVSACRWGDEPVVRRSYASAGSEAIHPRELLLASAAQYRTRSSWNARYGGFDWLPRPFEEGEAIDWVEARPPDGGPGALVPAACVYIGTFETGDESAFAVADSNGCAAGPTLEEAAVGGFLELVERDATAIWWHGGYRRPSVDLASIEDAGQLPAWLADRERLCHVLDITTDLGIPCRLAVSAEPNGKVVALGAAAHWNPSRAATSALTEMLQVELSLAMRRSAPADSSDGFQFWLDRVSLDGFAHLRPDPGSRPSPATAPLTGSLDDCLRVCHEARLRLMLVDLTRETVGVPVARAIVPGLQPNRARFGGRRLLDAPVRSGWRARKGTLRQLNRVPLSV